MISVETKVCFRCKLKKSASAFTLTKYGNSDGRFTYCKKCRTEYTFNWRTMNPDKASAMGRRYTLSKKFGITPAEYDEMFKRCGGVCEICGEPETQPHRNQRLAVDHCHKTGRVRGLLCALCNTAIGHFSDDTRILQNAIDYLNQNGTERGFPDDHHESD